MIVPVKKYYSRPKFGGNWNNEAKCGSQCSKWNKSPLNLITQYVTFRGYPKKVSDLSPNSSFKVEVLCPVCEKRRWVHYKSITKANHTICQKCMVSQHNSKDLTPGDTYNQVTIIEKVSTGISLGICNCGVVKEFSNESLRSGKTKSCGCLKKESFNNVIRVKGEKHGRWKGGTSTERERAMQSKEYKDWRQAVFHRDNFKCQICNQVGYALNAHHIQNYSDNEQLRTDIDNGVTLCVDCHTDFHAKYGRQNNNMEQLIGEKQ